MIGSQITTSMSKYIIVSLGTIILLLSVYSLYSFFTIPSLKKEITNLEYELKEKTSLAKETKELLDEQTKSYEKIKLEKSELEIQIAQDLINNSKDFSNIKNEVLLIDNELDKFYYILEDFANE